MPWTKNGRNELWLFDCLGSEPRLGLRKLELCDVCQALM